MTALTETDFNRIARAIEWIDAHYREQPSPAEIAREVGLSTAHFSRMFRRWSGLAPGRYVQHCTLSDAKQRLDNDASVLGASLETGMSGPGRLHDLFVRVEAMSPGEYKRRGAGLGFRFGFGPTPFGDAMLVRSERGIVELKFTQGESERRCREYLARRWPNADLIADEDAARVLMRVFSANDEIWTLNPGGTNFQLQVWRALLSIPPGSISNYGSVAAALDMPRASRAVGTAIGANPIAWLIPCHRVLQKNGALGGYRWGPQRKAAILGWEACKELATA